EGIDLIYHKLLVEETFFRMLRNREFDAAEMSLSSYCVSLMRDDPAFIAIPVFPSRFFRHSCIFVSSKSGIGEPRELVGKRIGVPEYQMTAPVWIRGILQDEYGVEPAGCEYWAGGEEDPGRDEEHAVEPQGGRGGAAKDLRKPRDRHGTGHGAARASRACRGGPPGAGRRLVALRLRGQAPRAGNVPALSARGRALEEAAESGRAC